MPAPTPAAPAAEPASPAVTPAASPEPKPAAPGTTPATGQPSSFVANALKALAPHQTGAPAAEPAAKPAEPAAPAAAPAEPAAPAAAPAEPAAPDHDGEDAAAAADIARETSNMPAAQKAAFTKLRYKLRDTNRQLKAAAEAQAAAGGAAAAPVEVTAEVERLKAELDSKTAKLGEFEKEVFATRLELTDEFRQQVTLPREVVATEISAIARRYEGVDQDAVIAAVQTGDPERVSRVTADMNDFDRHSFYDLTRRYHGINNVENGLRSNSKEALERISLERRTRSEAQSSAEKADWDKSLGTTWEQLVETFPVLEPIEGDPDWNGKLDTIKAFAAPDRFTKLTTKERAETLYRAAAFPVLTGELEVAMEQLKEAQDKLSKYEAASPGVGSAGASGGDATVIEGGFVANALAQLRRIGAK